MEVNDGRETRVIRDTYHGIPEIEALLQRLGIELRRVEGYSIDFSYNDREVPIIEVRFYDTEGMRVEVTKATTVPELEDRVKKVEERLQGVIDANRLWDGS
jgi:hypothetical protein